MQTAAIYLHLLWVKLQLAIQCQHVSWGNCEINVKRWEKAELRRVSVSCMCSLLLTCQSLTVERINKAHSKLQLSPLFLLQCFCSHTNSTKLQKIYTKCLHLALDCLLIACQSVHLLGSNAFSFSLYCLQRVLLIFCNLIFFLTFTCAKGVESNECANFFSFTRWFFFIFFFHRMKAYAACCMELQYCALCTMAMVALARLMTPRQT